MKAIQTFWNSGSEKDLNGWLTKKDLLISWSLSYYLLQRQFPDVELICNSEGKKILVDQLGLQYTRIHNILDLESAMIEKSWILAKTFSYSIQDTGFIHVDGDAFLFEKLSEPFLKSNLLAQNIEIDHPIYKEHLDALLLHKCDMPSFIKSSPIVMAANLGIVGGTNVDFFKRYHELVKDFCFTNHQIFQKHKAQLPFISTFAEQAIFLAMSKDNGLKINTLLKPCFRMNYEHATNFNDISPGTEEPKFIHLLATFKQKKEHLKTMHFWLKKLWPEQWNKIINSI